MSNLPLLFIERLKTLFGQSLSAEIQRTFTDRPTTFRVNTLKAKRDEVLEVLQREGFKLKRVPWYGDAFILANKKLSELQKLSLYQEGKIYVQSLASMAPPLALYPKPGEKVLDLTAAPGSKTSQIAALMKNQGELVANDNDEVRFQKLQHNLQLLGVREEGFLTLYNEDGWKLPVIASKAKQSPEFQNKLESGNKGIAASLSAPRNDSNREGYYVNFFDKILLDAPCTAEARIILKQPRTFSFWREKNIKEHVFIQRKLLFAAWEMLKPGGALVYSTCTFAPE